MSFQFLDVSCVSCDAVQTHTCCFNTTGHNSGSTNPHSTENLSFKAYIVKAFQHSNGNVQQEQEDVESSLSLSLTCSLALGQCLFLLHGKWVGGGDCSTPEQLL